MGIRSIKDLKENFKDNDIELLHEIFTFPLDVTRWDFYKIINLDLDNMVVDLLDTKENILYRVNDKSIGNLYERILTITIKNIVIYIFITIIVKN